MDRKNSQNSRRTVGSVPTYQQSLTSAQMARPTVQFSPPPNSNVVPPPYSSGYNSVPNTGYMPPNSRPYTKSGYNSKVNSPETRESSYLSRPRVDAVIATTLYVSTVGTQSHVRESSKLYSLSLSWSLGSVLPVRRTWNEFSSLVWPGPFTL